MKKVMAIFCLILSMGASVSAFAGNCQHNGDTAADGSRCGNRSADARPGGN